ncbi:ATP-binding protein [Streptomyces diastatochromogenes]|uniref:ATP-binding protein n=1 Tax=Streptomyces diastatochromogenes TaxID=42236 RepID=UPI0036C1CBFE
MSSVPEGELGTLSSGLQLAVYRIVQESLTNTLKHAGAGASAEVTIAVEAGEVRIRVADTGVPPGTRAHGTTTPATASSASASRPPCTAAPSSSDHAIPATAGSWTSCST